MVEDNLVALYRRESGPKQIVQIIGIFAWLSDDMAGDDGTAARVGFRDINRVVAAQEGQAVPKEMFSLHLAGNIGRLADACGGG